MATSKIIYSIYIHLAHSNLMAFLKDAIDDNLIYNRRQMNILIEFVVYYTLNYHL